MIRYAVTTHVNPMANSHVPMMTITRTGMPNNMFDYQAVPVPQDKTTLCDQAVLEALFKKYKRYR